MLNYSTELWRFRYFWGSLVRMDIDRRYRGTWLGVGWSLAQPLAMAAVMALVFHKLFNRSLADFAPMLVCGLVLWQYILGCAVGGCRCLVSGESFMRQVPAPMAMYPLRTVLATAFHFFVAIGTVFLGNALILGWEEPLAVLAILPTIPLLLLFGWSAAVLTGFAHAYFRDMHHLIEICMRMLFYATPIIYAPEMLRDRGMGWLLDINPLASLVEVVRMPLLGRGFPSTTSYIISVAMVLVITGLAILTLNRLERRIIFQL